MSISLCILMCYKIIAPFAARNSLMLRKKKMSMSVFFLRKMLVVFFFVITLYRF